MPGPCNPLKPTLRDAGWGALKAEASPTAPTSPPLTPNETKIKERGPLKYNRVYNEGAPKNNKHKHQRRAGVQKEEGENYRNVGLQVFLETTRGARRRKHNDTVLRE